MTAQALDTITHTKNKLLFLSPPRQGQCDELAAPASIFFASWKWHSLQ